MVRHRRRDEVHARDEAASRPNQAMQRTAGRGTATLNKLASAREYVIRK
jgi:hypothetical protein